MKKNGFYISLLSALAWVLTACGSSADRASLVAIDSLAMHNPDSACALLAAMPSDSLTTDDDKAYYALLTAIAEYKAQHQFTSDSTINIALNYYTHSGSDPDKRMRSLLYKGCVMSELAEYKLAMDYYKKAQYLCPQKDYYHQGYIYYCIAQLYQQTGETAQTLIYFEKAYQAFVKADNPRLRMQCCKHLGAIYRMSNSERALHYIKKAQADAKQLKDTAALYEVCVDLTGYHCLQKEYDMAIQLARMVIDDGEKYLVNKDVYYYSCLSYLAVDSVDAAKQSLSLAASPETKADSMQYFRCKSGILQKTGPLDSAMNYLNRADSISESLTSQSINNGLVAIDKDIDSRVDRQIERSNFTLIITLLFIAMLVVVWLLYAQRKKTIRARIDNEEALSQLSALNNQLQKVTADSQNHISVLKSQVAYLEESKADRETGDEAQLDDLNEQLASAEKTSEVQIKTRQCLEEILRLSFYSGKYNSDMVISNDSSLEMSEEFWSTAYEIVALEHGNLFERIAQSGISLTDSDKRLLTLCAINIPGAIIRRILNYKSIQVVSNLKRKLAKKVTGQSTRIEDVFLDKDYTQ